MFFGNWFSPVEQAWPFWLVIVGLLIMAIYRMARDKANLERPTELDRGIADD